MRSKKLAHGAKTKFVKMMPWSMPASEVSDAAAKQGVTISRAFIHNIRSAAAKSARGGKLATRASRKAKATESEFKALVMTLGVKRSKTLLALTELGLSAKAVTQ